MSEPLYLIKVNGLTFAESVDEYQMKYVLRQLAKYPELKVKVTTIAVEGVKLA